MSLCELPTDDKRRASDGQPGTLSQMLFAVAFFLNDPTRSIDREIQRLLAYPVRAIVVEAGWQFFERGEWRGSITPSQALGSLLGWIAHGVPILMAYDHDRCGRFVSRLLYTAARRRWREARSLIANVREPVPA